MALNLLHIKTEMFIKLLKARQEYIKHMIKQQKIHYSHNKGINVW